MRDTLKTVLVVNDLHVGSYESIMPSAVVLSSDNGQKLMLNQSNLQKFFMKQWQDMIGRLNAIGGVDICICNGDLVEGVNKFEHGLGNWTNDVGMQVDTAVRLLRMIGAKEYYGSQGSPYHTGLNTSADRLVMERLLGHFSTDFYLSVNGLRFYVRHDIGYSGVPHGRATSLNRDIINTKLNEDIYGNVDVHLYGHTHYSQAVLNFGKLAVNVPGWKARDEFIRRKSTGPFDCGYAVFFVNDDGSYTWDMKTFRPPMKYIVKEF